MIVSDDSYLYRKHVHEVLKKYHVYSLQNMSTYESRLGTAKSWVDPASLPKYGDASEVAGNAPQHVKQLTINTLGAYGVGNKDCFAHTVGKHIKIVEINVERKGTKLEASTVSEVIVSKDMLNGAGVMHGGCVCYIIDNCASFPLIVLGLMQNTNGVGVSQALNVLFHSPASIDTRLRITSTSVTLGGRIMTSRCEVTDMFSGRAIASAMLRLTLLTLRLGADECRMVLDFRCVCPFRLSLYILSLKSTPIFSTCTRCPSQSTGANSRRRSKRAVELQSLRSLGRVPSLL
ncbi:hypothetical protein A0H81_13648 [Grifola frondosa]|uniref:Thioesterase domain-containing protein n=1 Tax=Grifola frondosa TaxID=5627 RepID=A0A1C7LU96_GRIFR|nr:hypothetical protein A0H81_13648 [Grifola frondosa]